MGTNGSQEPKSVDVDGLVMGDRSTLTGRWYERRDVSAVRTIRITGGLFCRTVSAAAYPQLFLSFFRSLRSFSDPTDAERYWRYFCLRDLIQGMAPATPRVSISAVIWLRMCEYLRRGPAEGMNSPLAQLITRLMRCQRDRASSRELRLVLLRFRRLVIIDGANERQCRQQTRGIIPGL